jgi:hypothetical protein
MRNTDNPVTCHRQQQQQQHQEPTFRQPWQPDACRLRHHAANQQATAKLGHAPHKQQMR